MPKRPPRPHSIHPPQRIENPLRLIAHLSIDHGIERYGMLGQPSTHHQRYALHQQLHRERPGGYLGT